jgi:hypothetical protein
MKLSNKLNKVNKETDQLMQCDEFGLIRYQIRKATHNYKKMDCFLKSIGVEERQ